MNIYNILIAAMCLFILCYFCSSYAKKSVPNNTNIRQEDNIDLTGFDINYSEDNTDVIKSCKCDALITSHPGQLEHYLHCKKFRALNPNLKTEYFLNWIGFPDLKIKESPNFSN